MKSEKSEYVVVLCTTPTGVSGTLARFLVENRMAACVNIVPICLDVSSTIQELSPETPFKFKLQPGLS